MRLLSKLKKHPEEHECLWLFFDQGINFYQDEKSVSATVVVLGVVSSEGCIMPPHWFLQEGLGVIAGAYVAILQTIVKHLINSVDPRRPRPFYWRPFYREDWMAAIFILRIDTFEASR